MECLSVTRHEYLNGQQLTLVDERFDAIFAKGSSPASDVPAMDTELGSSSLSAARSTAAFFSSAV